MAPIARKFTTPRKLSTEKSESGFQGPSNLVAENSIDGTLFLIDSKEDVRYYEPVIPESYPDHANAPLQEMDGPLPSLPHMTKEILKRRRHEVDTDDTCRRRPPSPCPSLNFSQTSRYDRIPTSLTSLSWYSTMDTCEMDFSESGSPVPTSPLQATDLAYCRSNNSPKPLSNSPRDICMMEIFETSSPTPPSPSQSSSLTHGLAKRHISSSPGPSGGTLSGTFLCDVPRCNKSFTKKWNLEQHCRRVHSYQKPFQCYYQNCSLSFAIKSDCVRHYKTHLQERPHRCQICGNGFERRDRLRDHLRRIHKVDEE